MRKKNLKKEGGGEKRGEKGEGRRERKERRREREEGEEGGRRYPLSTPTKA